MNRDMYRRTAPYVDAVRNDGGITRNDQFVRDFHRHCLDNGTWDSIQHATLPDAGIKVVNGRVTKAYTLATTNNATQATPDNQPYLGGNIAPTGHYCLNNPNGSSRFMPHPTISFGASDSWSFSTLVVVNGFKSSDFHSHLVNSGTTRISVRHNNNNRFSVVGIGGEIDFVSSNYIFGKIIPITVTYNAGILTYYVSGTAIGTSALSIGFSFTRILQDEFPPALKSYAHIIRSQALTPTQVLAQDGTNGFFRKYIPEVESVDIGTKTWATSNCAVACSSNGTVIPDGTLTANWIAGTSYWCHHTNIDNGAIYDKLYNKAARNIIVANPPEGWHVATEAELTTVASLGGSALKLAGSTYWTTANGTNSTGLSLLGSSKRNADGSFGTIKSECYIWCADSDKVLKLTDAGVATIEAVTSVNDGYAIRLVKN